MLVPTQIMPQMEKMTTVQLKSQKSDLCLKIRITVSTKLRHPSRSANLSSSFCLIYDVTLF